MLSYFSFGLPVSLLDLQKVLAPYTYADPGRSITLGELQRFMDSRPVIRVDSTGARANAVASGAISCLRDPSF